MTDSFRNIFICPVSFCSGNEKSEISLVFRGCVYNCIKVLTNIKQETALKSQGGNELYSRGMFIILSSTFYIDFRPILYFYSRKFHNYIF